MLRQHPTTFHAITIVVFGLFRLFPVLSSSSTPGVRFGRSHIVRLGGPAERCRARNGDRAARDSPVRPWRGAHEHELHAGDPRTRVHRTGTLDGSGHAHSTRTERLPSFSVVTHVAVLRFQGCCCCARGDACCVHGNTRGRRTEPASRMYCTNVLFARGASEREGTALLAGRAYGRELSRTAAPASSPGGASVLS